jgi:hypothetical protein
MTKGILRKGRRPKTQPVSHEVLRDDLLKWPNTFDTDIFNIVETRFQLPPAFLSAFFATVFDVDLVDSQTNRPAK